VRVKKGSPYHSLGKKFMLEELVYSKYSRPKKLSDPYSDFTAEMLEDLLNQNDSEFERSDYCCLFGPHLPAGTYEEVMYFLPKAFAYLKMHEDDALDLVTPIFGFCSLNIARLQKDGLEEIIKEKIMECLNYWVRDFKIEHFDKEMCVSKGWRLRYKDLVHNSETVCEGTTDLVRFETLSSLAIDFTKSLAYHNGDITKASWFIEFSRSRFDVYTPPNLLEIQELLSDDTLLNEAYAILWPETHDYNLTYWRDTFSKLGL
jgi:hypothetical protein